MKAKALVLLMVVALMGAIVAAPLRAEAAAPATSTATIPITGSGPLGTLTGTLSNLNVVSQGGNLFLNGVLNGTVTNTVTGAVGTVTNIPVSLPLTASGSCQILDLTIGAINLNLLGLVVTTNPIHLNITAQAGSGNLLGNLLCAVAHLLDSNGSGNALSNLLNNILGQLTGSLGGLLGGL